MKNRTLKLISVFAMAIAMLTAGTQAVTPYTRQEYAITASAAAYGFTEDMTDAERVALAAEMAESGYFPLYYNEFGCGYTDFDGKYTDYNDGSGVQSVADNIVDTLSGENYFKDSGVTVSAKLTDYNVYIENPENAAAGDIIWDYTAEITLSSGNVSQTVVKNGSNIRTAIHIWFRENEQDNIKTLFDNTEYTNSITESDLQAVADSFKSSFEDKNSESYSIHRIGACINSFTPATSESEGSVEITVSIGMHSSNRMNTGGYCFNYTAVIPKLPEKASGRNRLAIITDNAVTLIMTAADVTVKADLSAPAAHMLHYPNSCIFRYDGNMNHIRTNSYGYGINGTGDVTVKPCADYAGRSVTLYSGRKSASDKADEGVPDSSGRITFTVRGGKIFTLIVEQETFVK